VLYQCALWILAIRQATQRGNGVLGSPVRVEEPIAQLHAADVVIVPPIRAARVVGAFYDTRF
jgi:hypothetical protein